MSSEPFDIFDSIPHLIVSLFIGFSDKPTQTGWNLPHIASARSQLMQRLGYRPWVAQGGRSKNLAESSLARPVRSQSASVYGVAENHSQHCFCTSMRSSLTRWV